MVQILNELASAALQLLVFTFVPFMFFLFRKEKTITFMKYIGLYRAPVNSIMYSLSIALLFVASGIGLTLMNDGIKEVMFAPNSVTGKLRAIGLSGTAIFVMLIISLVKTSLSEEVLFRGFLAKSLINKFGFRTGNLLQSAIFGSVHLLLFWMLTRATFIPLMILFIFSSIAAGLIGFVKEKYAEGSIVPGWIAHGVGNAVAYSVIAFVI